MAVYAPSDEDLPNMLTHVKEQVYKCFTPTYIQVMQKSGDRQYDVALGFKYDEEAIDYTVYHKKKILIESRKGAL